MRSSMLVAALALLAHLLGAPVAAQTGATGDQAVDLEEVRELRATAEGKGIEFGLPTSKVRLTPGTPSP